MPDTFSFLRPAGGGGGGVTSQLDSPAPFVVLGLQQMLLDGQLALYVVIKPVQDFDEKTLPETVRKTKVPLHAPVCTLQVLAFCSKL